MDKLIEELKNIIQFKDTTTVGDIVLIVAKEPHLLVYAYINSIERDDARKDEWWNINLSVLSIPPQNMTWTLRTPQMTGLEVFTMGGEERFFKAVDFGFSTPPSPNKEPSAKNEGFIKRIK